MSNGVLKLKTANDQHFLAQTMTDILKIIRPNGKVAGELKRIDRESPTLSAAPPSNAVVPFDGKNVEQFSPGTHIVEGLLAEGATTKRKFQSCLLHLEFMLPYMPKARTRPRK